MSNSENPTLARDATTIVEPHSSDSGFDATILEQDARKEAHCNGGGAAIAADSSFLDYRVLEPLRVSSAEADLWILQKATTKFVLKLYRFGIEPKLTVSETLSQSCAIHFVKSIATGNHYGRFYEIQEYIEHGSLAELIDSGLQEDAIRDVLKELCKALKSLHALKIIHRDIKPSNILVRSNTPLNLVLSDFGISSIADLSLHNTSTNRTAGYSAPEALTGNVKFASDWWSVGVILLEMVSGRHPFSGVSETAINYQLAIRGIPIQESVPSNWQLPAKGLLTRDPEQRWGEKELGLWLEGREDIPVYYTDAPLHGNGLYEYRPYRLDGKEIYDLGELAVVLAENWTEGVKRLGRGSVLDWVKQDLKHHDLAALLEDIAEDSRLDADSRLSVALLAIANELPLIWKGRPTVDSWIEDNPDQAAILCESAVGEWLEKIRKDRWLIEWAEYRKSIFSELKILQKNAGFRGVDSFNSKEVDRIVFSPARAKELATGIMASYKGATIPVIDAILKRNQPNSAEQIALALCKRSIFLTASQVAARSLTISINEIFEKDGTAAIPLDESIIELLATGEQWDDLLPMFQKLRMLVIAYDNKSLERILNADEVSYIELAALAAADGARCRVAFETLRQSETANWESFLAITFQGIDGDFPLPDLVYYAVCPRCGESIKSTLTVCQHCKFDLNSYVKVVCVSPTSPQVSLAGKRKKTGAFQCPQCSTHYKVPVRGFLWTRKQVLPKSCWWCGLEFPTNCHTCRTVVKGFSKTCSKCERDLYANVSKNTTRLISYYVAANQSHTAAILKPKMDQLITQNIFLDFNVSLNRLLKMNGDRAFYEAVSPFLETFNCSRYINLIEAEHKQLTALTEHLWSSSILSELLLPCNAASRMHSRKLAKQIANTCRGSVRTAIDGIYIARKKQIDLVANQCSTLQSHLPRLKSILAPDIGGTILNWIGAITLGFVLAPIVGVVGSSMIVAGALSTGMTGAENASDRDFVKIFSKNLYALSVLAEKDVKTLQLFMDKLTGAIADATRTQCISEVKLLLQMNQT